MNTIFINQLDTFFEENDILRREMGLPEGKVLNPSSSLQKKNLELVINIKIE